MCLGEKKIIHTLTILLLFRFIVDDEREIELGCLLHKKVINQHIKLEEKDLIFLCNGK